MTKPALGRSLGNLLEGSRKNTGPEGNPASAPDQLDLTSVTPGLGSLLRGSGVSARDELPLDIDPAEEAASLFGTNAPLSTEKPAVLQTQAEVIPTAPLVPIGLVQFSLIAADVLVQSLTWMLVRAQLMTEFWTVLLCFVSVSLGAWLACLAVFLEPEQPGKDSGRSLKK